MWMTFEMADKEQDRRLIMECVEVYKNIDTLVECEIKRLQHPKKENSNKNSYFINRETIERTNCQKI